MFPTGAAGVKKTPPTFANFVEVQDRRHSWQRGQELSGVNPHLAIAGREELESIGLLFLNRRLRVCFVYSLNLKKIVEPDKNRSEQYCLFSVEYALFLNLHSNFIVMHTEHSRPLRVNGYASQGLVSNIKINYFGMKSASFLILYVYFLLKIQFIKMLYTVQYIKRFPVTSCLQRDKMKVVLSTG